jgi:hypothetical protein
MSRSHLHLIFKGICIAAGAAVVSVANAADEYDSSKIAAVWESVTGRAIDTDTEIISIDGNMLTVRNAEANSDIGSFVWVPSLATRIAAKSLTDTTDWGKDLNYGVDISFVSGAVFTDGRPQPFVFVGYSVRYDTVDPQGIPLQGGINLVLPIVATDTISEADEYVARAEAVGKGGGKNGGIECYDPTWQGTNGEQCCGFLMALNQRLGACYDDWFARIFSICLPTGVVGGFATFKYCVSTCAVLPPPANASCAAACVGIAGLVGLDAFIVCMIANGAQYDSCVKRERAQYFSDLTHSGCEIRNPETAEYGTTR